MSQTQTPAEEIAFVLGAKLKELRTHHADELAILLNKISEETQHVRRMSDNEKIAALQKQLGV